ncbi:MAG: acyl-CoA synthetase [Mycobacterium sp.]
MQTQFNLATVFATVAATVPARDAIIWGDRHFTYGELDRRMDGLAHYLVGQGLGCRREREELERYESGQDHLGIYLRNGNEYVESMVASYRARVAPFNVNYRYVADELAYLLKDAGTRALIYHAEFAPQVAAVRHLLPELQQLIQVQDESGHALLPGAVDYEAVVQTARPQQGMPTPAADDLYLIYTGGTTGMPKGVMWRQHDIFVSSMGGLPQGAVEPLPTYEAIAQRAAEGKESPVLLNILPYMHGAAQWSSFTVFAGGGCVVLPADVGSFNPAQTLKTAERLGVQVIPVVGDAVALPLVEEIERATRAGTPYDLSGLVVIVNGSASLTPGVRTRILEALPHIVLLDNAGASESGNQMSSASFKGAEADAGTFTPLGDTAVLDGSLTRVLSPGEGGGWLARRQYVPLGYLGDREKTEQTFPIVAGERWSVPGDRADVLPDGRIRLLGRESVTINSGGEKIFVEEVERAVAAHRAVRDVIVVGRPSQRWGSEPVAVVELHAGDDATPEDLLEECDRHLARYKLPRAVLFVPRIQRSPSGKADYRWASEKVAQAASPGRA